MADTTFVNGVTLTDAGWFNDVNRVQYTILGNPADLATLKATLGITALATPISVANGGTNASTVAGAKATFGWLDSTDGALQSTTITGTNGVTGGGSLAANRTLSLDVHGLTSTTPASSDEVVFYSISGAANKKTTVSQLVSGSTQNVLAVRQTVLSAPVDSNGSPTFLPATAAALGINSQNIDGSHPIIVTSAQGFGVLGNIDVIGSANSTLTWGSLTGSATNYLYVTISSGSLTTGNTTLPPIYSYTAPTGATGQFWFDLGSMSMKAWSGSAFVASQTVFLGEAVTGVSTVTSTVAYSLNARYFTVATTPLPSAGTAMTGTHNVGTSSVQVTLVLTCLTAEQGYSIGDVAFPVAVWSGSGGESVANVITDTKTATLEMIAGNKIFLRNKSTGAGFNPTAADWNYSFIVRRSW